MVGNHGNDQREKDAIQRHLRTLTEDKELAIATGEKIAQQVRHNKYKTRTQGINNIIKTVHTPHAY